MRMVAAVIAAVLTVTTGGPLHCPCQFAPFVCGTDRIADCQTADEARSCPCHSHPESDSPQPPKRGGVPVKPCEHGPGIDFAASVTTGERPVVDQDSFDGPVWISNAIARTSQTVDSNGRTQIDGPFSPSESGRLKYCHSFRC